MSVCITSLASRARVLTLTISLAVFLACVAPTLAEPALEQPAPAEPVAEPSAAAATTSAKADSPATDTAFNISYELTEAEKRAIRWGMIPLDYSQFPELKDLPRDDTGRINFVRAINDKYLKNVKAEDNAALDVLRIMGSDSISPAALAEFKHYYPEVVSQLPKEGSWKYLSDILPADRSTNFRDIQLRLATSPWKAADEPHVAAWLNANEPIIERLTPTLKQKQLTVPVHLEALFLGYPTPTRAYEIRSFIHFRYGLAVRVRAMQLLHAGNIADAWQDLQRSQVAIRLPAEDAVDNLSKFTQWNGVYDSQLVFAQLRRVPSPLLKKWAAQIAAPDYTAFPDFDEPLDPFAEFDAFQKEATTKTLGIRVFVTSLETDNIRHEPVPLALDFNLAVTDTIQDNREFRKAMSGNTYADRLANLKAYFEQQNEGKDQTSADIFKTPSTWQKYLIAEPEERREIVTQIVEAPFDMYGLQLSDIFIRTLQNEYKLKAQYHLTRLAFLIAAFEQDKKRLPDKLGELVPDYIQALPDDPFVDAPLNYSVSKDAKSFSLWSVGPNLVSDKGKEDDVAVTVQVAE